MNFIVYISGQVVKRGGGKKSQNFANIIYGCLQRRGDNVAATAEESSSSWSLSTLHLSPVRIKPPWQRRLLKLTLESWGWRRGGSVRRQSQGCPKCQERQLHSEKRRPSVRVRFSSLSGL